MSSRARWLRHALGIALVAGLVVAEGRVALAAPSAAEADESASVRASEARFNEGLRLYKKHRYEEARVAFLQSSALRKRPSALLMVARCALETNRPLETLEQIEAYLALVPEPTSKTREVVELMRRDARARLGHLRITLPEGAVVVVDGERRVETTGGTTLDVMPGRHEIVATLGDETKTEPLEVVAGATVEVKPSFKPKAIRPAAAAKLEKPQQSAPPRQEPAEAGLLTPPSTTWPIVGAGIIGLGGLTAAVVLGGLTSNAEHAIDVADGALVRNGASRARCAQPTAGTSFDSACSTIRRNESTSRNLGGAMTASLVVGLSGVAIAAGWYLFAPKPGGTKETTEANGPRLSPWVSATVGGATVVGSF